LAQLQSLARLIGQSRDRLALDEERRNRERLEDRDALRRTLLASLAHDFRTPLTVVAAELERLSQDDGGAANALAEARRLDRMMADLLGAARIESGVLTLRQEAVDLVDIIADARATLGSALASLHVDQRIDSDLPLIDADPILLRHALINLLDNAARHTQSRVMIAAYRKGAAVELSVEDDGPGIAMAERKRIFERFARIEGNDRHGGSGLGLAIVKGFADAMNMVVTVEDGPNGGSRFILRMHAHERAEP
jgi:two-component system sensor histidine kinase KdpD